MASPAFSGELGLLGLFDLGQLLMLNGASGVLAVTSDGRKGYFYFERGQIVNAVDDQYQEGEAAAYGLFGWRTGTFEFRPEPFGGARSIGEGTEALMMEAARRLDEAHVDADGKPVSREAEKLRDRQGSMEALRDAFHHVARGPRMATHSEFDPGAPALQHLSGADDQLVYRPGHAPRLFRDGRWQALGDQTLDGAAYDQLKHRLLEGQRPIATHAGEAPRRRIGGGDGPSYEVSVIGQGSEEALWIRAAALPPPAPDRLEGATEALFAALARAHGALVTGAARAADADRLLHACAAWFAAEPCHTVLLIANDSPYQHVDTGGIALRAGRDTALERLAAMRPDIVAFDTAHADPALVAEARRVASWVLVAHVAPTPVHAASRARGWAGDAEPLHVAWTEGLHEGRIRVAIAGEAAEGAAAAPRAVATARPPSGKPTRPTGGPVPNDPMAQIAAELSRQLKRSA